MAQVSGRAGRKYKRGTVILQTTMPEHPIVGQVIRNDFAAMYRTQCAERHLFKYPPYHRIIEITLKHREVQVVKRAVLHWQISYDPYLVSEYSVRSIRRCLVFRIYT
jgi:primosomal protein N' (replication factor Y)